MLNSDRLERPDFMRILMQRFQATSLERNTIPATGAALKGKEKSVSGPDND